MSPRNTLIIFLSFEFSFLAEVEKQNKENGQKKEFEKKHSTCMIGLWMELELSLKLWADCKPRDLGHSIQLGKMQTIVNDHF